MTTRWSLVMAATRTGSPEAQSALATICEAYWLPVYHFVRHSGFGSDEARDLTQAFFTRLIEKDYLSEAKPERGRFRSFLLTSVRHFLSNELDKARAIKRGGGRKQVPIDAAEGERSEGADPAHDATPERIYERRWALVVLDLAMTRLAGEYHEPGRERLFRALRPLLVDADPRGSYDGLAAELGMSKGAVRVATHRLRQRFGACLRDVIHDTVERPDEVDEELQYLLAVVSR